MSRTPHWPFGASLWLPMFILHLSSRHARHDWGAALASAAFDSSSGYLEWLND